MRLTTPSILLFLAAFVGWSADWLTDGGDTKRTAWQRDEKILTTANAKDITLLWKTKLDNEPRQMHSLLPPLIAGRVTTAAGPKEIVLIAGVSDNLYALEAEKGTILWKKKFDNTWMPGGGGRGGGILCPGGLTATPVIGPTSTPGKYTVYAVSWDGRLHQLNLANGEPIAPPAKFIPPNGKPYALNLFNNIIYTHTAQGCGGNPNDAYT